VPPPQRRCWPQPLLLRSCRKHRQPAVVSRDNPDAELVDLVNQLFEAQRDWSRLNLIHDRMEVKKITGKLKRNPPVRKLPNARWWRLLSDIVRSSSVLLKHLLAPSKASSQRPVAMHGLSVTVGLAIAR
jgi:hypothetical protein